MANYSANDLRAGLKVMLDGDPCSILTNELVKPGKGQAFARVKLRNLASGRVWERTFKSGESLDAADVMEQDLEYSYTDGEFWYFMEQELNYPITMVDTDDFGRIDLDDYNTIVMPNGSYGRMLGKDKMDELKSWVRGGGRVIALEGALNTFADKEGFSLKHYADDKEKKAAGEKTDEEKEAAALTPYNERQKKFDAVRIPGAIFKLKIDNSHPMGFGYPNHYFTIKNNTSRYSYLPNGWNVGIIESTDSHISGVAGEKAKESLSKSLVFGVENYGGGAMIYMADNPLFRAFWENGKMFVANALFMVGQ